MSDDRELAARFPALARLETTVRRRRGIPWVQQTHATDCGAACLTMVLRYFRRDETYETVRDAMGPTRDGVTALSIVQTARRFGLHGRGVKLEPGDLSLLEPGAILHWEFRHFVVLESVSRDAITIVDPISGRRRVANDDVSRSFTGVGVVLEPGAGFEALERPARRWARALALALSHRGTLSQVLVTTGVLQLLGLGLPLLTAVLVERAVPHGDISLMTIAAVGVLDATAVLGYLLLLMALDPTVGKIVLLLGGLRVAVFMAIRGRVQALSVENVQVMADTNSSQIQLLDGMESLKAAGAESQAVQRWSHQYVRLLNVLLRVGRLHSVADSVLGALNVGSPLIVLCAGGFLAASGRISIGEMLAMSSLPIRRSGRRWSKEACR